MRAIESLKDRVRSTEKSAREIVIDAAGGLAVGGCFAGYSVDRFVEGKPISGILSAASAAILAGVGAIHGTVVIEDLHAVNVSEPLVDVSRTDGQTLQGIA